MLGTALSPDRGQLPKKHPITPRAAFSVTFPNPLKSQEIGVDRDVGNYPVQAPASACEESRKWGEEACPRPTSVRTRGHQRCCPRKAGRPEGEAHCEDQLTVLSIPSPTGCHSEPDQNHCHTHKRTSVPHQVLSELQRSHYNTTRWA